MNANQNDRVFEPKLTSLYELMIELQIPIVQANLFDFNLEFSQIDPTKEYGIEEATGYWLLFSAMVFESFDENDAKRSRKEHLPFLPETRKRASETCKAHDFSVWSWENRSTAKERMHPDVYKETFEEKTLGSKILYEWENVNRAFEADLRAITILQLENEEARFYRGGESFNPKALKAFPEIKEDVLEAARCFGVGCHTACVFHLMRAMEIGVQLLASKFSIALLDVNGKDKEWQVLVDQLEKAKNGMPHGTTEQKERQALYGHAIQHFANVKTDRARVMHSRDLRTARYDKEQAARTYYDVKQFYERMVTLK